MTVGMALDAFAARIRAAQAALDRGEIPNLPPFEPSEDLVGPLTDDDRQRFQTLSSDLAQCQARLQELHGQIVTEIGALGQRRAAGQAYTAGRPDPGA